MVALLVVDGNDGPYDDLFLLRRVLSSVKSVGSLSCGLLSDGVVAGVVAELAEVGESGVLLMEVGESGVEVGESGVLLE